MSEQNLTITKMFDAVVSKFPDDVALGIKRNNHYFKFTYRVLEIRALKVANFLISEGLEKGDCVSIVLENRPEWPIIYLGIIYAGLTCVPLDINLSLQDLKNLILDSSTKIIFCSRDEFNKKFSQDIQKIVTKIVVLDIEEPKGQSWISFSQIEKSPAERKGLPSVGEEDVASLIYTSGTTGTPKGVMLTHKNICSNFKSIEKANICYKSDNFLSILPLHHTYPFMVTLIVPLFLGASITYCPSGFKPSDLAAVIKEAGITLLVGVPQLFSLIHSGILEKLKAIPLFFRPLILPFIRPKIKLHFGKDLRLLVSGGARLEPKIGYNLTRLGFKVVEGYGLTETSPVASLNPPQNVKFGSVGKPIPDVEIRIDNADKSGIGQVLIKGPNVMKGYFKQPELTHQAIKDGWFYSGDLGYIDKDGYIFLTGREKEMIVLSSGKKINPGELEQYYQRSPYIKEICVLEKRQIRLGHEVQSLYAVVVPDLEYFNQRKEANIRAKIIWELENLARELPAYSHIMDFTLAKEDLPRTALRKLKRYKVQSLYLKQRPTETGREKTIFSQEDLEIFNQDILKKTMHYLSVQLKRPVSLDSHLEIDLGIDSLTRVELGVGLEKLFSIDIPDEAFSSLSTVKDVIVEIQEIANGRKEPQVQETKAKTKSWQQILKGLPKEEILKTIRIKPRLWDWVVTWIFKSVLLLIFRIFWLLRIRRKFKLPQKGPYIICPNHASYLDGLVAFVSIPIKLLVNTYFLGENFIFEQPLLRWAKKVGRVIPIDPNTHLTVAMQAASYVLSQGKIVCIFPEGIRSIDDKVKEFKKGVGILIKELDVGVIPAYIKGSHKSWPRGDKLPHLYPLKITFGRKFSPQELMRQTKESIEDDYVAIARSLREEVLRLASQSS